MTDWNAGYVSDIEYMPGFYREQAPAHLDLACLIAGVAPPEVEEGVSYCELGCGVGMTSLLLGAADPSGHFVGIDFNPAHIARGRALAKKAGLANVDLVEASFAELTESDTHRLPQFDYVTLHGVYSWISAENRRAVVHFLARHLKPGGIAYVSYNAMPGWMMGLPLQRMLSDYASLEPGRSDRAIERSLAFLRAAQQAGARPFSDPEIVSRLDREIERGQIAYLAHEYLNQHWTPLYHGDVAREFAAAKLDFVGSATVLENFPALTLTPEQRGLLDGIEVGPVRETFKDYFLARAFRRDIFVRGARHLPPWVRDQRLRSLPLAMIRPRQAARHDISVPLGEAQLEERAYAPMFDALAEGSRTIGELLSLPQVAGKTTATPVEVAGMLVGSSQALALPAAGASPAAVVAFNRAVLEDCIDEGRTTTAFAAAGARTGLYATLFDLVTYAALADGVPANPGPLAEHAWRRLEARGDCLRQEGKPIEGAAANLAVLRDEIAKVLTDTLPIWRHLGVL